MCLPKVRQPDFSAQMEAQQNALAEEKKEREKAQQAEAEKQRDAEMKKAAAEAKRQMKKRRGRTSLISRTGGSRSLGILDYTPTSSGLRPLGETLSSLS